MQERDAPESGDPDWSQQTESSVPIPFLLAPLSQKALSNAEKRSNRQNRAANAPTDEHGHPVVNELFTWCDAEDWVVDTERTEKDLRTCTFSEFKKTDARRELLCAIAQGKFEPACYWCAELVCAGHLLEVWESVILYLGKCVHLSHTTVAPYLQTRMENFRTIVRCKTIETLLEVRNIVEIRRMFGEIMCVLCSVKRRHSFDMVKIRAEDMNVLQIKTHFRATSPEFAAPPRPGDPAEIFPFMNELAFAVTATQHRGEASQMQACFWLEWIYDYEARCKTSKQPLRCAARTDVGGTAESVSPMAAIPPKHARDVVWMIWENLLFVARHRSPGLQKIARSLMHLFCLKYGAGTHRRRKLLLYVVIALLCEPVHFETAFLTPTQQAQVQMVKQNVDHIYDQIAAYRETMRTRESELAEVAAEATKQALRRRGKRGGLQGSAAATAAKSRPKKEPKISKKRAKEMEADAKKAALRSKFQAMDAILFRGAPPP